MNCYGHGHLVCKLPINVTVPRQPLGLALKQRLDCERGLVAYTFGSAGRITGLAGPPWRIVCCVVSPPVLLGALSSLMANALSDTRIKCTV